VKYLLLVLLLSSCSPLRANYTVFLREDESIYYNLQGNRCIESGYELDKQGKELITFYSNCEFHKYRLLKEFELNQWSNKKHISVDKD